MQHSTETLLKGQFLNSFSNEIVTLLINSTSIIQEHVLNSHLNYYS